MRIFIVIEKTKFFGFALANILEAVNAITFLTQISFFKMNNWFSLHFKPFLFSISFRLLFFLHLSFDRT
jgi:hypothetical protein